MKVYIGPYKHYIGPFQIARKILFLANEDTQDKFGEFLCNIKYLQNFCEYIYNKRKRNIKIKIHSYDVWNMDYTLALIILPMLKKLKKNKHGSTHVDDEDVPENIRSVADTSTREDYIPDCFYHERWTYVLDQIIWSFQEIYEDSWEDKYHTENHFDVEGYKAHQEKISVGLKLFGKYFQGLWS